MVFPSMDILILNILRRYVYASAILFLCPITLHVTIVFFSCLFANLNAETLLTKIILMCEVVLDTQALSTTLMK